MKAKFILAFFLAALCALWGQQDRATLTGTVTDPSGAVVPNVKITAIQVETGAVSNSESNAAGQYRIPNLPIGMYRVTFEAGGFKTVARDNIQLSVSQVLAVNAQLQIGNTSETVEVKAETSLLQTETPEVGTLLGTTQVIDMPLGFSGGRYAENFAYKLTPGVGGDNWTSHINGAPAFSKEVVLDGASASIYISGQMGESSPSMEALDEFKVQTSGMSAEYTRTAGGVFNFVMKSGANQYHGSGNYQWHNESFDANTFANNFYGRPRRLDRRDDWAASLGGPVGIPGLKTFKDKWFFYAAYEKYNESFAGGGSPTVTMPLSSWLQGDLSNYLTGESLGTDALGRTVYRGAIYDPTTTQTVNGKMVRDMFPGNKIPASRISKVSQNLVNILNDHYLPPINSLLNNSFFPVSNQAGFNQTQFSTKSDFNISNRQRLSGSFVLVDRPRTLLDQGGAWEANDPNGGPLSRARLQYVASHYVRLAHDYTLSPTMMNHVTIGFGRQINPSTSKHMAEDGASALGITGMGNFNYPQIAGLSGDRVGFPQLGYTANDVGAGTAYQLVDTFSWIRGKHSFKFGFDYRWNGLNWRTDNGPGQFNFAANVTGISGFNQTGHGFASMLLGAVSSASGPANTPTGSQFAMWSGFFQDDWKVTSRLTLNLGVRYDYQPQGTEKWDRLHNFNPSLIDPKYGMPGAIEFAGTGAGRDGKRMFYDNCMSLTCTVGPRLGFAYQLPNAGWTKNMTLRGGYGLFYSSRIPDGWSGVPWGNALGFTATNTINQAVPETPTFNWDSGYNGKVVPATLDPSAAATIWGPVSWDPDGGKIGYTQQWNFNIQRELKGNMVFDLGYIGTKSTGLKANELRKMNQIPTSALALGDTLGSWINNDAGIPAAAKAMGAKYPYANDGTWIPVWQTLTPYPTVINWSDLYSWNSPLGFSDYQALEVQLNKRFSHGVQWMANYTFSKNIGNVSSAFGDTWGQNGGRPLDYYNLSLEKSVLEYDQTHVVKIGASYDLPFGHKRAFGSSMPKVLDFAVGGWTVQYIGNYNSGTPVGFGATGTPNSNFATNRPFILLNDGLLNGSFDASTFDMTDLSVARSGKKYIDTSKIINPTTINRYLRGNAPRLVAQLRNFGSLNEDFSLQKNFTPREGMRIQFRAEGLNLFNRHRFTGFNTSPSSPLFGQISGVSDDRRQIQFGVRADF